MSKGRCIMKAELCPVCSGSGKYNKKQCHGCNSMGWILIPETNKQYVPYLMPYPISPEPTYPWNPNSYSWYPWTWDGTTSATPLTYDEIIVYS